MATKVLCVVGTRPEAIKMAPVIQSLQHLPQRVLTRVCATGQHKEMLQQPLDLFGIRADYELSVMEPNQGLPRLTARLLDALDGVVSEWRPDWVLAQGDTTTVLVAGLIAFYHRARFGHVEAGLRTGDKDRPFPEEANRRMASVVADLHFAPTERARQALLRENVPSHRIVLSGNTVVDAVLSIAARPYSWEGGPLAGLPKHQALVLVTAHRRESFGAPFRDICAAIRDLVLEFGPRGFHFVYPVHLNPNIRGPAREFLDGLSSLTLVEPLDYASMVHLMSRACLILTDSGGIQEEAPTFGIPVLVMRETTERPEGVEAGLTQLVGTDRQRIVAAATALLAGEGFLSRGESVTNPYGDGRAAERIVAALLEAFGPVPPQ